METMIQLTEKQIKSNDNIPTSEIIGDIIDTQREIDSYESELISLRKNPVENKLDIYFREGRILIRKEFIAKLEQILQYRNNLSLNK
jgi:hypothetical protein